jgi:hypothetical protein
MPRKEVYYVAPLLIMIVSILIMVGTLRIKK